jgi:7-cyano-7-deazaguanine synthase
VAEGLRLKVPYELTWSCYEGHEKACGVCGTCIDRKKAFELNGATDPIEYEN